MWTTTVCSSQLLAEWCRFVFGDKCNQLNIWLPHSSDWMISVCKCGEVKFRAQQPTDHVPVYGNLLSESYVQCFCVQLDFLTGESLKAYLFSRDQKNSFGWSNSLVQKTSSLIFLCRCWDLSPFGLCRLMSCFFRSNAALVHPLGFLWRFVYWAHS